jgi:hypothetical protein
MKAARRSAPSPGQTKTVPRSPALWALAGALAVNSGSFGAEPSPGAGALTNAPASIPPALLPPDVKLAPYDTSVFRSYDPGIGTQMYNPQEQLRIYGGKYDVGNQRPPIEIGRPLYGTGRYEPEDSWLGKKNLLIPGLSVYGDWRNAIAYNDFGNTQEGVLATRLNLDVDLKLTATERIHAFFGPFDQNGTFSEWGVFGPDQKSSFPINGNIKALYFEGDLGSIYSGLSGNNAKFDLPIAAGFVPLLFQNGIWVDDAFIGGAFTIPARNCAALDISNMDVTFFAGFDEVSSQAIVDSRGGLERHDSHIYGATTFIEAWGGYWEFGYGYTQGLGSQEDFSYSNMALSYTRRYFGKVSNSLRVIGCFGQDPPSGQQETANGVVFLMENSLITSHPLTLVPYLNLWVGIDKPQSLARDANAGGILKNTGILFETDGMTGSPTLDATANDTYGAALGIEYLFNLNQQLIFEVATVQIIGDVGDPDRNAVAPQYGVGARYQIPINKRMIFRADALYGWFEDAPNVAGVRSEIRIKF